MQDDKGLATSEFDEEKIDFHKKDQVKDGKIKSI